MVGVVKKKSENMSAKKMLPSGTPVVVTLHTPREKIWGLLDEISLAGVFLRGLDLNSFEDWVRSIAHDEPVIGIEDLFLPMWRVERIAKDEAAGGIPSLFEQAKQRTAGKAIDLLVRS
jgi:hypothetical protein